jgi:hypothetical protein
MTKRDHLREAIINKFIPHFTPEAKLLYAESTAELSKLARVGIPTATNIRLPDVVLHLPKKKLLCLIELHKPISPQRHEELESLFAKSGHKREYVSAFADMKEYAHRGNAIAWNTHVWIAKIPQHMIHYNGEKFFGPWQPKKPKAKRK